MTAILRHLTGMLLAALALLLCETPTRAAQQPLTPQEQALVNRAIAGGVFYLKATQGRNGSWAEPNKGHEVGYAALPALTLLESGVPANDPAIQRAAGFVRQNAFGLDGTYEVALTILFLDRLNDPRDKALIQMLAVRLIAGQTQTGGWGYKVPKLTTVQHQEFIGLLRRAYPKTTQVAVAAPTPKASSFGTTMMKDPNSPPGTATTSGTASPEKSQLKPEDAPGFTLSTESAATIPFSDPRSRVCLKMLDSPPPEASGDSVAPPAKAADKPRDWVIPLAKAGVVPIQYQGLTVFQEPTRLVLVDPPNRGSEAMAATTDNSNTQFAILALWAAQRHDVPMDRTLMLLAYRFVTSQNRDGSWDYHYKFGGTGGSRPAMTAVGLLGLAVGYGLNNRDAVGKAQGLQDPLLLQGFVALNKNIGTPTGQMQGQPMVNLYVLWSIERVAVLYNLTTVGDKDWYRWGAEILVSNQQQNGNWDKGGYHGASPAIDTCFALLFLKRANLAQDLTGRLPFNADSLTLSITDSVQADEQKNKPPEPPAANSPTPPGNFSADGNGPHVIPAKEVGTPDLHAGMKTPTDPNTSGEQPANVSNKKWTVLIILLVVFLLALIAGLVAIVAQRCYAKRQPNDTDEEDEEDLPLRKSTTRKKART